MRRYEIMVILDPDLEEKTIAPSLEAFLNVIRADGGTVHNVEICQGARPPAVAQRGRHAHQGHARRGARRGGSRVVAAGDVNVTIVGNLTNDPELRFTPSGAAVASFTVASTPRVLDKATNEWKDGEALFMRCSVWRQYAENVAESLTKGSRVIVTGRLKQRSYETREGEKRTVVEMDVDEVGPALKYATAKVNKVSRGGGGFGDSGGSASSSSGSSDDPWASGPSGGAGFDEPPF
jgi:single-strand DNA-binding protein